jgi:protein-disulfide isomerase
MSVADEHVTKNQRRDAAREKARQLRADAAKRARRRKVGLQAGLSLGVIVIVAAIAAALALNTPTGGTSVAPKNMASGGILLTGTASAARTPALAKGEKPEPVTHRLDGKTAHIQIWLDYQCPICQRFEAVNRERIEGLLKSGKATLEIHPVAVTDSEHNDRYATRSAAAMGCVAEYRPDDFLSASTILYDNQPDEATGTGLTDKRILELFGSKGLVTDDLETCIKGHRFTSFVSAMTHIASRDDQLRGPRGISTPTIVVNGEVYQGSKLDGEQFGRFIETMIADAGDRGELTFPTP